MSDLNDLHSFILQYLKLNHFEKSSKLLAKAIQKPNSENWAPGTIERFKKYLIELDMKVENDDLGFEINFGAGLTALKVISF